MRRARLAAIKSLRTSPPESGLAPPPSVAVLGWFCFRSFGFEFQEPCSVFTLGRARKRDPKAFSLAAHNEELVLRHVTLFLQQLFQISLERRLCFNQCIERLPDIGRQSSASMFCHFNSSLAITQCNPIIKRKRRLLSELVVFISVGKR
jgi:hypothetical protein